MGSIKFQGPLLLVALLASRFTESQPPPDPAELVNYQWQVLHSKKPNSNDDCLHHSCLNAGDVLVVKSAPPRQPGAPVKLHIDSTHDAEEYEFEGSICDYNADGASSMLAVSFVDTAADSNDPPLKLLTIHAVQMRSRGPGCVNSLRGLSRGHLRQSELEQACAKSPLMHWRVQPIDALCQAGHEGLVGYKAIVGDPDDGQGTGNGLGGGG